MQFTMMNNCKIKQKVKSAKLHEKPFCAKEIYNVHNKRVITSLTNAGHFYFLFFD